MTFRSTDATRYNKSDFLEEVYMDEASYDAIVSLLKRKKNIILQGAPGTGKTFAATRLAYSLMGATDNTCIEKVQFHQGSSYEDYIVGFKPTADGLFAAQEGLFTKFFRRASDRSHRFENYYLIIDEINRANLSKVFGELLMLIEADHRGESLVVPGLPEPLTVPKNLFIIGMMNTADRGLALVDYALRRRFAFYSKSPELNQRSSLDYIDSLGNDRPTSLVDAVRRLNDVISHDSSLGEGFCIGHSYFCFDSAPTDIEVKSIVDYELRPLLQEYWFDSSDKEILDEQVSLLYEAID